MSKRGVKPWERQEGESVQAFEAFTLYLEMGGERSLRAVGQKLGKSSTLIERWSATKRWVERAAAYDADLQQKAYTAAVSRARKMADRHIRTALQMQEKALLALEQIDPAEIRAKDMIAMIREALKLERESRSAIIADLEASIGQEEDGSAAEDVVIYLPENGRSDPA